MTETASAVTFNHLYRHVPGSNGTVVPGCEVQIGMLPETSSKQAKKGKSA